MSKKVLGIWPHPRGMMMGIARATEEYADLDEAQMLMARDLSKPAPDEEPQGTEVGELAHRNVRVSDRDYTLWYNARSTGELNRVVVGLLTNFVDPDEFVASAHHIRGPVLITGPIEGDTLHLLSDDDVASFTLGTIQNDLMSSLRGMSRDLN